MSLQLMDCTLRDGGNIFGKGFDAELTDMILDGLTNCGVPLIELGNAGGIGAYEVSGFTQALPDHEYLKIAGKYLNRGSRLGMFLAAGRCREQYVQMAAEAGLSFLRVGANAGEFQGSLGPIRMVKRYGMKAFYSLMKAYLLTPGELAEEAKALEDAGLDQVTIMDSAGTMLPEQAAEYAACLSEAVKIPVAFHGHNNLGLSAANMLAACEHGASMLDCSIMGMARSAGNAATELCVGILQRRGELGEIDLYGLLNFIDARLLPAMEQRGWRCPLPPLDLVLGLSGCHSSNVPKMRSAAAEAGVNLFRLIMEVSAVDRKAPSEELIQEIAGKLH